MAYQISFRKRAAAEYLESVVWYKERSQEAAKDFIKAINNKIDEIENKPDFFRKTYKQFHEAKTLKFPFSIVYFIDEKKKLIVITSIFHQKRNPKIKFKD
ncbi:MAG TPA: type II toxin-antitoxin system RelE/ParE family toxin [Chitinophagaceae bacterium]|nr:type II toxin-antitoxin system RelE/ParE family toxin [Chitinophagaceae bacterium]